MKNMDLTKGSVFKTLCVFALPMILGNMLQQGYNIVDTWVVGKFIGSDALAAVGSAFALMTFLTSVLIGLCMGGGTVFSFCKGKNNTEELESGIFSAFVLIAAVSVFLTAVSATKVDFIVKWLNTPSEIEDMTRRYLLIVFAGIPAVFLYNFFGAYLKSVGNSVVPLIFLGVSTAVNIALDLIFVISFNMGSSGAAEATVIAQYISGIGICIYVVLKSGDVRNSFLTHRLKKSSFAQISNYSFLTCIQQAVMNFGILMIQGLVNSFGTTVMAAFAAGVKIDAFAYMTVQEYANSFSTFIAQNKGAGKRERIIEGIKCAVISSSAYGIFISCVMWLFGKELMLIFVNSSETAIIEEGVRYLHIEGTFYFAIGILFLLYGLYRALAKPFMSVVLTVISLGSRVLLAYTLSPVGFIGVKGIWWAIPVGWILADITGAAYCFKNKKKLLVE